jgi:hypothetical protein
MAEFFSRHILSLENCVFSSFFCNVFPYCQSPNSFLLLLFCSGYTSIALFCKWRLSKYLFCEQNIIVVLFSLFSVSILRFCPLYWLFFYIFPWILQLYSVLLCAYCMYIYNIGFMIPSMMECHTPNCYDLILAVIMKPSTILNLLLMFFQKAPSDFYLSLYCFFHCLGSFSIKYSA